MWEPNRAFMFSKRKKKEVFRRHKRGAGAGIGAGTGAREDVSSLFSLVLIGSLPLLARNMDSA
jgi:hypothetical protein